MRVEIKDNRVQSLIDGAELVFFEKGYAASSISDICKRLNCSRTTIYSYFDNKENLYLAVVDKCYKLFIDYFTAQGGERLSGRDTILELAKGYMSFSRQFPKEYAMILDFYTLLKHVNSKQTLSDTDLSLSQCAFFPEVKIKAEIPFSFLVGIISHGQKDGSITKAYSAQILFLNLWAYLIGSYYLSSFSNEENGSNLFDIDIQSDEQNALSFIRKILD